MAVNKTILLLCSEFPPQPGGIGNHAWNLAKVLHKAGRKVIVLSNARGNAATEEKAFDAAQPFQVCRIPRYRWSLFTYLGRLWAFFKHMIPNPQCQVIASGKFSLWTAALGTYAFPAHHYLGVLHGTEINPAGSIAKWLTHKSLGRFNQLVAVSAFTRNLALTSCPDLAILVLHNGFDPQKFAANAKTAAFPKTGYPTLLSIGQLSRRKGQHNVIHALPMLKTVFPKIQYHIVGIPTTRTQLEKLAKTLGVTDSIIFHNSLDDAAISSLLQQCDILMQLSENTPDGDVEGFGIAILEANAAGLPVIGSLGCGIEDAVRDGFSGRLVSPHQPAEIRSAIEELMAHYPEYAANAREWAKQFSWEIRGQAYLEIL